MKLQGLNWLPFGGLDETDIRRLYSIIMIRIIFLIHKRILIVHVVHLVSMRVQLNERAFGRIELAIEVYHRAQWRCRLALEGEE